MTIINTPTDADLRTAQAVVHWLGYSGADADLRVACRRVQAEISQVLLDTETL